MQVYGKTGYLGEYELSSIVSEQVANGSKEYSGPLAVKHVGLCTRDGPKETTGQIRFQVNGSSTRATATLVFEGVECTYDLSESYHGFMNCADHTSLPLRLWTKRATTPGDANAQFNLEKMYDDGQGVPQDCVV